jgi:hypothetical protein
MILSIFGRPISISEPLRSTPEPLRPRSNLTPVALRARYGPTPAPNQSSGSLLLARPQSGAQKLKSWFPRAMFPRYTQIVSEDRLGQNVYRQFDPTLIHLIDFRVPIRPHTGENMSVLD